MSKIKSGFEPAGPFELTNKKVTSTYAESSGASSTSVVTSDEEDLSEVDIADLSDVLDSQDTQKFARYHTLGSSFVGFYHIVRLSLV